MTILAKPVVNATRNGTSLVDAGTWTTAGIATMTLACTSVAVRAHTKNRNRIREIETRNADPIAGAVTIRVTFSRATWTCREDSNARSCAIVIANTRCAARNRERWQPSARFEWSPVAISETTTIVRRIRDRATFDIFANGGWSRRLVSQALATPPYR